MLSIYATKQQKNIKDFREKIFNEKVNFNEINKYILWDLHKYVAKPVCNLLQLNGNIIN